MNALIAMQKIWQIALYAYFFAILFLKHHR